MNGMRSRAAALAASIYGFYAALAAAAAAYCFWLAGFMVRTSQPDAAGVAAALKIGAVLFAALVLVYAVAAAGLWRFSAMGVVAGAVSQYRRSHCNRRRRIRRRPRS